MPKPYTPNDKWSQRAADEGYRARSVYKLQELDEKNKLIKPGMTVLDLGAAPGSWLQYVSNKMKGKGKLIGIDMQEIKPIEHAHLYLADITEMEVIADILGREGIDTVDVILSDLAPKTSGIKDVDQWKSIELSKAVIAVADKYLKPKGTCVIKVFRGADFDEFLAEQRKKWKNVKIAQVEASRDRSREVYLIIS